MSELNGIYVDINGDIKCRLGDSGFITISDLPTDDDYKVSLGIFNPADRMILNEVSVQSDNEQTVQIPISVAFTTSLGVGRFFYGIKLTDTDGHEQTILPKAVEDSDGNMALNTPNCFIVRPLLVEGETSPITPIVSSGTIPFTVVNTYADLAQLVIDSMQNNAVVKVLADSTHNGQESFYRFDRGNNTFVYVNGEGPYATYSQLESVITSKQDVLTDGPGITISGNTISNSGMLTRVDKSGDTMTGDLDITKANAAVNLTNSNNKKYIVMANNNGNFDIKLDASNGKGLFLNGQDNEAPYYNDGTNTHRLLTSEDSPAAYIIETYHNGTDWYRVWSDGWCEQGGKRASIGTDTSLTINLLKHFSSTDYSVFNIAIQSGTSQAAASNCTLGEQTTSTFILYQDTEGDIGGYWEAKGYIAIGE